MLRIGIGQQAGAHSQRWQPLGVEAGGAECSFRLCGQVGVLVGQVAGCLQVGIDGLAGNEQVHDLGGALEDAVDAQIPHQLFNGDRPLPAGMLRGSGLVAAAPADLEEFVGDPAGDFRAEELGQGGLDAHVLHTGVGQGCGEFEDCLHGEGVCRNVGNLFANRLVFPHRLAPLDAGVGPFPGDLQ